MKTNELGYQLWLCMVLQRAQSDMGIGCRRQILSFVFTHWSLYLRKVSRYVVRDHLLLLRTIRDLHAAFVQVLFHLTPESRVRIGRMFSRHDQSELTGAAQLHGVAGARYSGRWEIAAVAHLGGALESVVPDEIESFEIKHFFQDTGSGYKLLLPVMVDFVKKYFAAQGVPFVRGGLLADRFILLYSRHAIVNISMACGNNICHYISEKQYFRKNGLNLLRVLVEDGSVAAHAFARCWFGFTSQICQMLLDVSRDMGQTLDVMFSFCGWRYLSKRMAKPWMIAAMKSREKRAAVRDALADKQAMVRGLFVSDVDESVADVGLAECCRS